MNAVLLLMATTWGHGVGQVPADTPPAPITMTAQSVVAVVPENAWGGAGWDEGGDRRPTFRERVAGVFRRLCFWKRDAVVEVAGSSPMEGRRASLGAPFAATYLPPAGTSVTTASPAPAADQVQTAAFTPGSAPPADEVRAKLVVALPPGARLFIDDRPADAGSGETTFQTPPLTAGRECSYTLRAEIVRDGQTIRVEMQVEIRAGEQVRVSFLQGPTTTSDAAQPPDR